MDVDAPVHEEINELYVDCVGMVVEPMVLMDVVNEKLDYKVVVKRTKNHNFNVSITKLIAFNVHEIFDDVSIMEASLVEHFLVAVVTFTNVDVKMVQKIHVYVAVVKLT